MLLLTCPYWMANILNNELKRLWYTTQDSFDTGTFVDVGLHESYHINLRSRIANKVFLRLGDPIICTNFDDVFDLWSSIDWKQYFAPWHGISIKVHLRNSNIDSIKHTQSILQKSITTSLTGDKDTHRDIDEDGHIHTLFVVINENMCSIYMNTSGDSLHQRGYREDAWDAPLKENVAAALVQLANRKYTEPFLDPCCGSGTICIEAAMIARNIAPWRDRFFAFEEFPIHDAEVFENIQKQAKEKEYKNQHPIFGADIDPEVLEIAKQNAKLARVDDTITFQENPITESISNMLPNTTLISNPPYGKRLAPEDLDETYQLLETAKTKKSIIISGYEKIKKLWHYNDRKQRKTKNGAEEVTIYIAK